MMKHILLLSLGLMLLVSCTPTDQQPTPEETLDEQKEKLREYVRSQLNSTQNTSQKNEVETPENKTPTQPEEEIQTPQEEPTEEIKEDIDLSITFVDFSGERNFDIDDEDDSITAIVGLKSSGIEDGESVIGKVSILASDNSIIETCLFLYTIGKENELECELKNFEDYGTFDYQVFIDENDKYTQVDVNLSNNIFRGEIEIES